MIPMKRLVIAGLTVAGLTLTGCVTATDALADDSFLGQLVGLVNAAAGANGNDNGAGNTNDNGADNGNDNGAGNTNDNGNAGDLCPDGSLQVRAELAGGDDGKGRLRFRSLPGGCKRFRARVDEGVAPGDHEVAINNVVVGHIVVDADGRGELEFDSEDGTFPADFPDVAIGDVGDIGGVLFGTFALHCSETPQTCNANSNDNGNDNGAGNTNDNGAGNTNDNGAANTNDNGG